MTVIAFGRIPLTPDQCLVDGVDGGGSAPLTHRCFPSSYLKTSRYLVSSMSYLMYRFFSFLHLFKVFFSLVHIHTLCNSNFFCMLRVARVQPVVTDTLARFFSFHPFQNVFLFFFVVSKPNSDRFPNTRPSFPWSTTLAQKWLKQATFPVVLASVFSFMFSIHQLLMISIHHAVVKPSFLFFSIILLVLLNNSSYIYFEVQRSIFLNAALRRRMKVLNYLVVGQY